MTGGLRYKQEMRLLLQEYYKVMLVDGAVAADPILMQVLDLSIMHLYLILPACYKIPVQLGEFIAPSPFLIWFLMVMMTSVFSVG